MSKKKTIYIHIGSPKTGTSSIQSFLTINNKTLIKKGIFYPLIGRKNANSSIINGSTIIENNKNKSFKKSLKEFNKNKCSSILFSDEVLFLPETNFCDKIEVNSISKYNVKIIVYLRNSCEYLCGLWQEEIRNNSIFKLEDFIRQYPYIESLKLLYNLSEKFGKRNIIVRPYNKNLNVIADFFSIFNINIDGGFCFPEKRINSGISRNLAEKFLYLNKYLNIKLEENPFNVWKIIKQDKNNISIIDSLPKKTRRSISEKYNEIECKIAKDFLNKDKLFCNKDPVILDKKRSIYKKLTKTDKEELKFIINLIINKQNLAIQHQNNDLIKKILTKKQKRISKLLISILCTLIPLKKYRKKIRSYIS